MRRFVKPLALVLVALLLVGGGLVAYTQLKKDGTYTVTAFFEKGIGLFPNSDVTVLGVEVGKIRDVEPEGERVRVVMDIFEKHKIPADARAQIVPISVIADRYVEFSPVYEGGAALQNGDVLGVDRTQIPAELDDVFRGLKKLLDAIEPGKPGEPGALGDLIVQLDETLREREDDLKGTLIHGSRLTSTLARARGDISGLLVNLDALFGKLATRAESIGELNRNFAVVMATLAESRDDLEGTLHNVGDMTWELGKLFRAHRDTLGRELALAGRITSAVLRNRGSVEESLEWLWVVGWGLSNAYHGGEVNATDVRDNVQARLCEDLELTPEGELPRLPIPIDPGSELEKVLKEFIKHFCPPSGGGGRKQQSAPQQNQPPSDQQEAPSLQAPPLPELPKLPLKLDCDKGVKRVKRQLRRISDMNLPDELRRELVRPLKKQLRRLARKCRELGDAIEDSGGIDDLLETPGEIPELGGDALPSLSGSAAGTAVTPAPPAGPSFGSWVRRVLSFIGWPS